MNIERRLWTVSCSVANFMSQVTGGVGIYQRNDTVDPS
jgi:hypothetical protein